VSLEEVDDYESEDSDESQDNEVPIMLPPRSPVAIHNPEPVAR